MIVDFTVSNFRSIKDEQTLSLYVAMAGDHLQNNVSYPAKDKIGVLKAVGLYGANASGKSNLLYALYALQSFIVTSGNLKEGDAILGYEPYLLVAENKCSPIRFEIEFFVSNTESSPIKTVRYRYCVAFTAQKIVAEKLVFYPSGQPATLFERGVEDTWQTINFGSLYKGGKKRLAFFANNAYLSKAGDSADAPAMIREVYRYFRKKIIYLAINEVEQLNWLAEKAFVENVSIFLSLVDTGIDKIVVQEKMPSPHITHSFNNVPESLKLSILEDIQYKPFFAHLTETGNVEFFEEKEESDGTQKLFHLAPLIFDVLLKGGVLIIDELDNSMHPFMAELLIKMFNDSRINKNNAQLIFSTHNIHLMSAELLRRDQIWFIEKQHGASHFYSLDDFDKKKVKPQSPFNQWYAEGRFGAIPAIHYQGIVDLFNTMENVNAKENQ